MVFQGRFSTTCSTRPRQPSINRIYDAHTRKYNMLRSIFAALVLSVSSVTASMASPYVADYSAVAIPPDEVAFVLREVSAQFDSQAVVLFARLRVGRGGYFGYVNAALEYESYIPFFIDRRTSAVAFGPSGALPHDPDDGQ